MAFALCGRNKKRIRLNLNRILFIFYKLKYSILDLHSVA